MILNNCLPYTHFSTKFVCLLFIAKSTTQPTAILAAGAVCNSFQVVSESTPTPPQGSLTKHLIGKAAILFISNFCLFIGFVPETRKSKTSEGRFSPRFRGSPHRLTKKQGVGFAMTTLNFFNCCLPGSKSVASGN